MITSARLSVFCRRATSIPRGETSSVWARWAAAPAAVSMVNARVIRTASSVPLILKHSDVGRLLFSFKALSSRRRRDHCHRNRHIFSSDRLGRAAVRGAIVRVNLATGVIEEGHKLRIPLDEHISHFLFVMAAGSLLVFMQPVYTPLGPSAILDYPGYAPPSYRSSSRRSSSAVHVRGVSTHC